MISNNRKFRLESPKQGEQIEFDIAQSERLIYLLKQWKTLTFSETVEFAKFEL
ncbi:MAG: hypothetical protein ACXACO_19745 [Promethearchaeota archaeon]